MLANPILIAALSVLVGWSVLGADTSITAIGQNASVVIIGKLTGVENGTETGQFVLTLSVIKPL